ncbi:hypothetical protein SDC9_188522 [bioreactor metagenome]|uniref:Uncharacterized protein n=1 Tax=bioreactor metagenome TaxID=1076179 RepID=A0A645HR91_9ZZZZ
MQADGSLVLREAGLIHILCDMGQERCDQFEGSEEYGVERISDRIVLPRFHHLHVVVGELVPYEVLDLLHRLVELVLVEERGGLRDSIGVSAQYPPVRQPQGFSPLGFRIEEAGHELTQIEYLVAEPPSADDILLPEGMVYPQ